MNTRILTCLLGASVLFGTADTTRAHGGMYRGPADIVPPGGGGGGKTPSGPSGPKTGGPAGPSAPAPTGPTTGGPGGPRTGGGGGPGGGAGPRTGGVEIGEDLSTWDYWWEFNKDSFLRLKDHVHRGGPTTGFDGFEMGGTRFAEADTQQPTREQVRDEVLPALRRAIDSTDQRDIASACMIAMAKIGQDHPTFTLVDVFRPRVQRRDQEIRETAALAIGIAGLPGDDEVMLLSGLALDDATGRKAYGGEVDMRTRAFAMHGLGLLAYEHNNHALQSQVVATLRTVLRDERLSNRNLKVAAISSLGLLHVDGASAPGRALLTETLDLLAEYFGRSLGSGEQLMQAHVPIAIARLLRRDGAGSTEWKERFAAHLHPDDRRSGADIDRSCVLALGMLCSPADDAQSPDAKWSELLRETFANHRDSQTQRFAVLALGQIGGDLNRTWLLQQVRKAKKGTDRPWFALALGVMAHLRLEERARTGLDYEVDRQLGNTLLEEFEIAKEPSLVGAFAIGLGLCRHLDAAPQLQQRLLADVQKEQQAGYLALGLGLMHDRGAIEVLRDVIEKAARRPVLMQQAATALGLLGDRSAAELLWRKLAAQDDNLATFSALAGALGRIGDRRAITPLTGMLFDERRSALTRAFAAAALGGVADRAALPWHAKIAANLNYRAAVETLTDGQSGILDIL